MGQCVQMLDAEFLGSQLIDLIRKLTHALSFDTSLMLTINDVNEVTHRE